MSESLNQTEPTDEFTGLVKFALDHGLELIRNNGVLVPFMISVAQGDLRITTFSLEPGAAVESAKDSARRLPPEADAYAIVFIGDIRLSGKPYNAVVVEASKRGQLQGFRIGQPFESEDSSSKIRLVGDAVNLGSCEQLMA